MKANSYLSIIIIQYDSRVQTRRVRCREAMFNLSQVLVLSPHSISLRGNELHSESLTAFPETAVSTQKDEIGGGLFPPPTRTPHTSLQQFFTKAHEDLLRESYQVRSKIECDSFLSYGVVVQNFPSVFVSFERPSKCPGLLRMDLLTSQTFASNE